MLDKIVTNSKPRIRHHARFGDILEYRLLDGKGARFSTDDKKFIGFIEWKIFNWNYKFIW